MEYTVYSYEIIDGDLDFLERIKEEGKKKKLSDAYTLARELDEASTGSLVPIIHLVYDENGKRM